MYSVVTCTLNLGARTESYWCDFPLSPSLHSLEFRISKKRGGGVDFHVPGVKGIYKTQDAGHDLLAWGRSVFILYCYIIYENQILAADLGYCSIKLFFSSSISPRCIIGPVESD